MKDLQRISLAVFLVTVVLGGDRGIALVARAVVRRSHNQFVLMYEGKCRVDYIFLGDSRADRNFNFAKITELTGRKSLNLGLGGNSVLVSEVLLKDYMQRYDKPEIVVIELSQTLTNPGDIGEMGIFSYCSRGMAALAKRLNPTYAAFGSVFKSLKYNDPAFWRLAFEAFRRPGPRLLQKTIPPEKKRRWSQGQKFNRPIYEENMKALGRICSFAEREVIRLEFLVSPCWKGYLESIVNYAEWIRTIQQAAEGYVIRDYSRLFYSNPEYFNDELHLNAKGATRFAEILVADGVFDE